MALQKINTAQELLKGTTPPNTDKKAKKEQEIKDAGAATAAKLFPGINSPKKEPVKPAESPKPKEEPAKKASSPKKTQKKAAPKASSAESPEERRQVGRPASISKDAGTLTRTSIMMPVNYVNILRDMVCAQKNAGNTQVSQSSLIVEAVGEYLKKNGQL